MKTEWKSPGKEPVKDGTLPVEFETVICRVSTMADGGYRVWLDISENETPSAVKLLAVRNKVLKCRLELPSKEVWPK